MSDTWTGKRRTELGERKQEKKKGVIAVKEDEEGRKSAEWEERGEKLVEMRSRGEKWSIR